MENPFEVKIGTERKDVKGQSNLECIFRALKIL